MRRIFSYTVTILLSMAYAANALGAGDQLYVTTNTGTMYLLRNLQVGQSSLANPGSMSVKTLNVVADTTGVIPGGFTLANIQTTATPLSGGGQVVLGTTNGNVLSYDANLTSLKTTTDICNGCGKPVQALAVGQFGDLPVAVVAAHTLDAPLGTGGFDVQTYNSNMQFIGRQGYHDDGTGSDPDVTALRFGNLDAGRAGNELFIGTTNRNTIHKNSGLLGAVAKDPAATAGNPLPPQFIWDTDGDVGNGVTSPWFGMNNTIADAYVANSIPDSAVPTGTDEITVVGQTNDFTGPDHEGPHQFGTMVHTYYSIAPSKPFYAYENAGARANQVNRPMLAAVAGNVFDSDPNEGGFDMTGSNELVWAGIDELRICNGYTHCSQVISTNQRLQKIWLADVLHSDGVLEIVVATSDAPFFVSPATDTTGIPFTGGRILVYEHATIGDLNTNFVFDPTNATTPRGAIIELGATISVTGLASLAATAPVGLLGDYNGDSKVDAIDYTIWRDTLGSTTDLRANGDNSGASANKIDNADYIVWKNQFGASGSGSGGLGSGGVPEPSALVMLLVGLLIGAPRFSSRFARGR